MFTVNTCTGMGIIRKGNQKLIKKEKLSYKKLEKNRKERLNLISVKEFKKEYIK